MSFWFVDFWYVVFGVVVVFIFVLFVGVVMVQDVKFVVVFSVVLVVVGSVVVFVVVVFVEVVIVVVKFGDVIVGQGKVVVCGVCYGIDGNLVDLQYLKFVGQYEVYIVCQLINFKVVKWQNLIMFGMVFLLFEQDMYDIGVYFVIKVLCLGVVDEVLVEYGQKFYCEGDVECGILVCMVCYFIDGCGNLGVGYLQFVGQYVQYVEVMLKFWYDGMVWGDDVYVQIMLVIVKKFDVKDIIVLVSYIEGLYLVDSGYIVIVVF